MDYVCAVEWCLCGCQWGVCEAVRCLLNVSVDAITDWGVAVMQDYDGIDDDVCNISCEAY